MTTRANPPAAAQSADDDDGSARVSRHQTPQPRLPHERDQSADKQQDSVDDRIDQAARDLENGLVDTGRSSSLPVQDAQRGSPSTDPGNKDA